MPESYIFPWILAFVAIFIQGVSLVGALCLLYCVIVQGTRFEGKIYDLVVKPISNIKYNRMRKRIDKSVQKLAAFAYTFESLPDENARTKFIIDAKIASKAYAYRVGTEYVNKAIVKHFGFKNGEFSHTAYTYPGLSMQEIKVQVSSTLKKKKLVHS